MWTSCFTPCFLHASITFCVPTTVPPLCSGQPPFIAAPTWITVSAPLTARSTADRIAEVAERVLDARLRLLGDPAHEHADLVTLGEQALDRRLAERARRRR